MRTRWFVLLLAVITAIAAFLLPSEWSQPADAPVAPRATTEVGVDAPELRGHATPRVVVPAERPWWLNHKVESVDPAVTRARLEAHWWRARPEAPFDHPDEVFPTDVTLVDGRASVSIEGNARPGYVVVFVVENGVRSLAEPFFNTPVNSVAPGQGLGPIDNPIGTVLVGAHPLPLRLVDPEGQPLAGVEVEAHDLGHGWFQRKPTGPDGRVRFNGFRGPDVDVSWRVPHNVVSRPERGNGIVPEFADGPPRTLALQRAEQDVRVARNPRVRLRGRVAGASPDAWCPIGDVRVTDPERTDGWSEMTYLASHGFSLAPGRWRCTTWNHPVGNLTADTTDLALDQDLTLEVPIAVPASQGWLEVAFDTPATSGDPRIASAVEVRAVHGMAWEYTAPHDRLLVLTAPGTYEVTGAIRAQGTVRLSAPRRLTLNAGERASIVLATEPAGGLRFPQGAGPAFGGSLLVFREGHEDEDWFIEEDRFVFSYPSRRDRATTWWMHPGTWTLVQMDVASVEPSRISVVAEPGRVLNLHRGSTGLLAVPP